MRCRSASLLLTMARYKRINEDRWLTSAEKSRRFDDKHAAIDQQLDEAFANVDQERKARGT